MSLEQVRNGGGYPKTGSMQTILLAPTTNLATYLRTCFNSVHSELELNLLHYNHWNPLMSDSTPHMLVAHASEPLPTRKFVSSYPGCLGGQVRCRSIVGPRIFGPEVQICKDIWTPGPFTHPVWVDPFRTMDPSAPNPSQMQGELQDRERAAISQE